MLTQRSLFDDAPSVAVEPTRPAIVRPPAPRRPTAEQLKREGIERAAENADSLLGLARGVVFDIARGLLPHADGVCRADGLANADDLRFEWDRMNARRVEAGDLPLRWLGNAAGAVFRNNLQVWTRVGLITSEWTEGHGNAIGQWALSYPERAAD